MHTGRPLLVATAALHVIACDDAPPATSAPDLGAPPDLAPMLPTTPAGTQLAWLLATENGPASAIDEASVTPHFTPEFLTTVPPAQLVEVLQEFAAMGPWAFVSVEAGDGDTHLSALLADATGAYWRWRIVTEPTGAYRMAALLFSQAPDADPSLATFAALDARVAALAQKSALLVAEVKDGACTSAHALAADTDVALGSQFKLWVLGALATKVAAGDADWDATSFALRDDWKSVGTGDLDQLPAGTVLTLRQFATKMISISDNTAADHLIHWLGRDAVEAALAAMQHAMPSLDEPFLTTREMFALKLEVPAATQQQWAAATVGDRRAMLPSIDALPLPTAAELAAWRAPILVDQIEWFATPTDVCHAFAALKSLADGKTGQAVYDVLAVNPGIAIDTKRFPYVGYKGGSEPGVLTLGWLLQRSDGRWFVVTLAWNDARNLVDENAATYLAGAAVALAGRLP